MRLYRKKRAIMSLRQPFVVLSNHGQWEKTKQAPKKSAMTNQWEAKTIMFKEYISYGADKPPFWSVQGNWID